MLQYVFILNKIVFILIHTRVYFESRCDLTAKCYLFLHVYTGYPPSTHHKISSHPHFSLDNPEEFAKLPKRANFSSVHLHS